jgi:hypothetical protein
MKRDLDLARKLLLDIEARGPSCVLSSLRSEIARHSDDRVRYHLRLLIDAQLIKELDRNPAGLPCVRLTNAGHELIELARDDARWHDAVRLASDSTGGQSLTVVRAILTKWAVESASRGDRTASRYAPVYHRPVYRQPAPRYGLRPTGYLADPEPIELVRTRPDYRERCDTPDPVEVRERFDWRERYERLVDEGRFMNASQVNREFDEASVGVSLPVYIV